MNSPPETAEKKKIQYYVGLKFKFLKEGKGETLENISKGTGLSIPFLSEISRGYSMPSIDSLDTICNHFEITLSDFFDLYK